MGKMADAGWRAVLKAVLKISSAVLVHAVLQTTGLAIVYLKYAIRPRA